MWIPFFLSFLFNLQAQRSLPHPPRIPMATCCFSVSILLTLFSPSNACFSHLQNPIQGPKKKLFQTDLPNCDELILLCHHLPSSLYHSECSEGCKWGIICLLEMEPMSQCSLPPSITLAQCLAQKKPVFIVGLFNSVLLCVILFSLILSPLPLLFLFHMQRPSTLNTSTINNRDGRLWTSPNLQTDVQKSQ